MTKNTYVAIQEAVGLLIAYRYPEDFRKPSASDCDRVIALLDETLTSDPITESD